MSKLLTDLKEAERKRRRLVAAFDAKRLATEGEAIRRAAEQVGLEREAQAAAGESPRSGAVDRGELCLRLEDRLANPPRHEPRPIPRDRLP